MMAQALWESSPEVGSSRNRRSWGYKIVDSMSSIQPNFQKRSNLRSKLNPNSRPLPLLDTKRPNHSIRNRVQPTHLQTFLSTKTKAKSISHPWTAIECGLSPLSIFLCNRDRRRLAKTRREDQRLPDSRRRHMRVRLLHITRLGLEVNR
jgi:hypothetical protein